MKGKKESSQVRPTLSLMSQRKGLSTVVATVIMIALVMAAVSIVWGVVTNLVEEELEGVDSCISVFDKVEINGRYTCYDPTDPGDLKFQFSLNIRDIDVEEVLFAISDLGSTKTFKISNNQQAIPGISNFPYISGSQLIILPNKNGGSTYIYNLSAVGFGSKPDLFEIAPVIEGKQCGTSSTLTDIPNCATLI